VAPDRLEELVIEDADVSRALAPLFAATTLVTLNISAPTFGKPDIDYRLICRAIEASSDTLRAVSICFDHNLLDDEEERVNGPAIARALTSCTSLRFLQLGFPIVNSIGLYDLFMLLHRLRSNFCHFGAPVVGQTPFTTTSKRSST
jgi:hypothetical protein